METQSWEASSVAATVCACPVGELTGAPMWAHAGSSFSTPLLSVLNFGPTFLFIKLIAVNHQVAKAWKYVVTGPHF